MNINAPAESVKIGKTTLHRTSLGGVWFIDTIGHKRQFGSADFDTARKLFDTIKEGSGELSETKISEGTDNRFWASCTPVFKPNAGGGLAPGSYTCEVPHV